MFPDNPIYQCNATSHLGETCQRYAGHPGRHGTRFSNPSIRHAMLNSWLHDARED